MEVSGLLVDLDGTLYSGGEPVPGAVAAVERFRGVGMPLRFVTNTTRKPRRAVFESLVGMGFLVEEREILTPVRTAAAVIGGGSCLPLVDDSLLEDLRDVHIVENSPDFVLVGDLGSGFTYERLNGAFRTLMGEARLVALQKNRFWKDDSGDLSLDAGPFVAALEYASGKTVTVVGKPEESFFRLACEGLGLAPERVAMIGDDPTSDVAGARKVGMKGVQVKTGKYEFARESGGEDGPNLTVESFAELPEALGL